MNDTIPVACATKPMCVDAPKTDIFDAHPTNVSKLNSDLQFGKASFISWKLYAIPFSKPFYVGQLLVIPSKFGLNRI